MRLDFTHNVVMTDPVISPWDYFKTASHGGHHQSSLRGVHIFVWSSLEGHDGATPTDQILALAMWGPPPIESCYEFSFISHFQGLDCGRLLGWDSFYSQGRNVT